MSELTRRQYEAGDYDAIPHRWQDRDLDTVDRSQLASSDPDAAPHARTWLLDGTPVACGGVYPLWNGVGEAWFHCSDNVPKNVGLAKDILKAFDEICAGLNLRRVQARAQVGFPEGHMLIAYLGFQPEALLKKYGPDGRDYIQYVLFPGDGE